MSSRIETTQETTDRLKAIETWPTREVIVPPKGAHLTRASVLLLGAIVILAFEIDDLKTRVTNGDWTPQTEHVLGFLCLVYGTYYLVLAFRARVVLTTEAFKCRGIGPDKSLSWPEVSDASATGGVRQGGVRLTNNRIGVSVLKTDGTSFWLPGFDSSSAAAMESIAARIMSWRTRLHPSPRATEER